MSSFEYYRYDPSLAAAVIFIIIFASTTAIHIWQMIRVRTWIFIPLIIGGLLETIGYIGRAVSHSQTPNWTLGPYVVQFLLLLVAPAFFAASIYMLLGRLIVVTNGQSRSLIKLKWLTKLFVLGDCTSLIVQFSGGGIEASDPKLFQAGNAIIIVGLWVQVVMFFFFCCVTFVFHVRMRKAPTEASMEPTNPWRRHLHILYITSGLILARSVVRIAEYIQGNSGYITSHEVFLYVFDALLMSGVLITFNFVHPTEVVKYSQEKGKRDAATVELKRGDSV